MSSSVLFHGGGKKPGRRGRNRVAEAGAEPLWGDASAHLRECPMAAPASRHRLMSLRRSPLTTSTSRGPGVWAQRGLAGLCSGSHKVESKVWAGLSPGGPGAARCQPEPSFRSHFPRGPCTCRLVRAWRVLVTQTCLSSLLTPPLAPSSDTHSCLFLLSPQEHLLYPCIN